MPSTPLTDHPPTGHSPATDLPAPRTPADDDSARPDLPSRLWHAAGPAVAVYAGALVLHLVLLSAMITRPGTTLTDRLTSWDGRHFLEIASGGYPDSYTYTPQGELTGNNLAFFPLFPWLVRLVHAVTGLSWSVAGIVAAQLALLAALVLIHQLVARLYSRRTATIVLVLLAAAQPMSLVFFMSYSESLLLATAAATLLAAHRRAWITAGVFAFLAGLTRPAGIAVIAALGVAALIEMVRERRVSARPLVATALACTSTPLYLWWVADRLGSMDAWFTVQRAGWDTHWDWGASLWDFLVHTLQTGEGWVPVSIAVLVIAHLLGTALTVRRTTWPPLLVYGGTVIVLTLAQSNYYHCKPRLLAPALIFLLPVAGALARARRSTQIAVLAGAALFGCWYGAYMVTAWPYAI
ncbi:glycosyltransferase family 39 protein [Kitasatospora sp. CB01950]|uniref:glycosyltransferase family 39 protein n=1 Tax=Kitasatospora sp. CB01950 TaxID=1703930 RepID=UPI0009F992BA|nr:glycosyltransferase family 39 protein [Kitasatospora sp. CB01950]